VVLCNETITTSAVKNTLKHTALHLKSFGGVGPPIPGCTIHSGLACLLTRMGCRCFWDASTDAYAQDTFSNVSGGRRISLSGGRRIC